MKNLKLVKTLIEKGYHISTAESCTGGLVASHIVDVPDASKVLDQAFVTYANEAKIQYLGVSPKTLKNFGAVSYETAYEMVTGLKRETNAEVCVATTGIAGPTGGTKKKPVGLVWFGFMIRDKVTVESKIFSDLSRNEVRKKATEYAYDRILELLEEK